MLTSFYVKCTHAGCGWRGSLLPKNDGTAWAGATPTRPAVVFQCPQCQTEWRARVIGDDVVALRDKETSAPALSGTLD